MATIIKDIQEESDKITKVKRIIKNRSEKLEKKNILPTPLSEDVSWKELPFSHPENTIRIGTVFSGIGAFEHAFQRLGLKHQIMFAGDIDAKCKESYFANAEFNLQMQQNSD